MEDFQIKHKLASGHVSAVATGIVVAGPLSDDLVPIVFYRDTLEVVAENYFSKSFEGPLARMELSPNRERPTDSLQLREDVATILVPASKIADFAAVFKQVAEMMGKIAAQTQAMAAEAKESTAAPGK